MSNFARFHRSTLRPLAFIAMSTLVAGCDYTSKTPKDKGETVEALPADQCKAVGDKAVAVLSKYCQECHSPGGKGARASGLKAVLDIPTLISGSPAYIVPGDAPASLLYSRSAADSMPPSGETLRPSPAEVQDLRTWIEGCGAADPNAAVVQAFIPFGDILGWINTDLSATTALQRPFIRYVVLTHLQNAGAPPGELPAYAKAISVLLNSLSWNDSIVVPKGLHTLHADLPADADTVLRIDLRDYVWDRGGRVCDSNRAIDAWEELVSCDPYVIPATGPTIATIRERTATRQPLVLGDWLVFAAARPPLYQSMLGLPRTVPELEAKCLGVADYTGELEEFLTNPASQTTIIRSAFDGSGVSANNRLIERLASNFAGPYWKSYDFNSSQGQANLHESPLGPVGVGFPGVGDGALFVHAGGEMIFGLPNGLQAYYVTNGVGAELDEAPSAIVSNKAAAEEGDSAVILNGLASCQWCHSGGILDKADTIRDLAATGAYSTEVRALVERLHPPHADFAAQVDADKKRHVDAYQQAAGTPPPGADRDVVIRLGRAFQDDVSARRAAAELGMSEAAFLEAAANVPASNVSVTLHQLGAHQTVKRAVFSEQFHDIVCALGLAACTVEACGVPDRCRIPSTFGQLGEGEPCTSGTTCDGSGHCVSACGDACQPGQTCGPNATCIATCPQGCADNERCDASGTCVSACSAGCAANERCNAAGTCVSACSPACTDGKVCDAAGACQTVDACGSGCESGERCTATGCVSTAGDHLEKTDGDGQTGAVDAALAKPVIVTLSDVGGQPIAGVKVDFAVTAGGGHPSSASRATDADGHASVTWTLGTQLGANGLTASVSGVTGTVAFTATGVAGQPAQIIMVSGQNQIGARGATLAPFEMTVADAQGNPVAGVKVDFLRTSGSGSLSRDIATTTAFGRAATTLTLGTGAAEVDTVEARTAGATPLVFRATIGFGIGVSFGTCSTNNSGLVVATLDADARPDIALQCTSGGLSILHNTSVGGALAFAPQAELTSFPGPNQFARIAAGDLNADTRIDLAATLYDDARVLVFLNASDGDPTAAPAFDSAQAFSTGAKSTADVAIGDMNGDTKPDLAMVTYFDHEESVIIRLNATENLSSNADFTTKPPLTLSLPAFCQPVAVAISDLDHDGRMDFAVSERLNTAPKLAVFRNTTPINGTLSFAEAATPTPVAGPNPFAFGDFNGDTGPDIAVGNYPPTLSIFTHDSNPSTLTYTSAPTIAAGGEVGRVVIADVNGDGLPDVVMTTVAPALLSIFLNRTHPGELAIDFAPRLDFPLQNGYAPIGVADFNGDGRADIVVGDGGNSVTVFLGL